MTWAIFTTPEDHAEMISAFTQAGLTGGEWNRIKDYAEAYFAGWEANVLAPAEHPCTPHDPTTLRMVVMNHGTKAAFLSELTRLINRPQRDRIVLTGYRDLMTVTPWYAVDPYPPAPGFFDGMTCT